MERKTTPRERFLRLYPLLGVAGSAMISAVILFAALTYSGRQSEPFSFLNHFISELGQLGVSRSAALFNAAMVVSGALFIPYCVGLGLHIGSLWSRLGTAVGVCAGVFCAGVGFFPMNNLPPHITTSLWFFRCGLGTTLLFGVAVLAQRGDRIRIRKHAALFSLAAVAAYGVFLALAGVRGIGGPNPMDPAAFANRPRLWLLAVLEWSVFFATVLWFLGVALMVKRRN